MELAELRCFLVLAEELHFGRTAERLYLTQPRVSQTIRRLEEHVGAPLFERTSRRVRLTPLGERFLADTAPVYQRLLAAVSDARGLARSVTGTLRIAFLGAAANELTGPILEAFCAGYPEADTAMVETDFVDPLGPLRSGRADVMLARLPVDEPDLTVGPVLVTEPRALALPVGHRLAGRAAVSAEELAQETVLELPSTAPDYWREFHVPSRTPSGLPIPRCRQVDSIHGLLSQIAAGCGVAVMVECMPRFFGRPDVVFVPVADLPWSPIALVWPVAGHTPLVRAFAQVCTEVVRQRGGPEAGRGPHQGRPVP